MSANDDAGDDARSREKAEREALEAELERQALAATEADVTTEDAHDVTSGARRAAWTPHVMAGDDRGRPSDAPHALDTRPASPAGGATWPYALALALLVFAAFWPALSADFVNWDDPRNFLDNPNYRGLGPEQVTWMFTSYHMAHWHPLTWLTLGLDYVLWGMKPAGYHLTSVLIHAMSAAAAFVCARLLFARIRPAASTATRDAAAFLAAALFAVHPLRAESVAWVTERRDVLSGLFFFLALAAWLRSVAPLGTAPGAPVDPDAARGARRWSVIFFVLAGMSKVSVFVLPFLLLVLDVWPLQRLRARGLGALVREKTAHFAVAFALMFVAWFGQKVSAESMYTLEEYPIPQRLVQVGFGLFLYPFKTFAPRQMSPMYELPSNEVMLTSPFVVPALIGAGVALVALALGRKLPALAAAWACFLITIAPTSGITQAGSQIAADRYSYLSCVPFALLVAGALFLWPRPRAALAPAIGIGALLVGGLAYSCWNQTLVWRDSEGLWRQSLVVQPWNTFAHDSLAALRASRSLKETDPARKLALLREAYTFYDDAFKIDQDPRHLLSEANTIRQFAEVEPEKRDEHLRRAFETLENGLALARQKGKVKPAWSLARANLLLDLGRVAETQQELSTYLQAVPTDAEARYLLGLVLVETGHPADGLPHLQFALDHGLDDVRIWAALAECNGQLARFPAAREGWSRVIALRQAELGAAAASDPYVQVATQALQKLQGR